LTATITPAGRGCGAGERARVGAHGCPSGHTQRTDDRGGREAHHRADGGTDGRALHGTGIALPRLRIRELVATGRQRVVAPGRAERELVEVARVESGAAQFVRRRGRLRLVVEDACHDVRHILSSVLSLRGTVESA
jgi:hypothetical protein